MSRQTFVFDTRLPVGENVSERDPAHPKNVMRNAAIIQNQAMADTKYDIYPPKRVEAFSAQIQGALAQKHLFTVAAILAVIVGITISMRVQNMIARILLILIVVYSLHYLVAQLSAYSN